MRIYNKKVMLGRRREPRWNMTDAEKKLWQYLRNKQVDGVRFRRQFSVGNYVIDFFAPSIRLAIEVDGGIHELKKKYDRCRQQSIEAAGIRFLRFTNTQIKNDIDTVLAQIKSFLTLG
jgi:very-short-patch-repair endonuclease